MPASTQSTPEKELQVQDPTSTRPIKHMGWQDQGPVGKNQQEQQQYHQKNGEGYNQQTPHNNKQKKPFKRPYKKNTWNRRNSERDHRDNRGSVYHPPPPIPPPYHPQYYNYPQRSPVSTYNRYESLRPYQEHYYQPHQYNYDPQRSFLDRDRRDYSPRRPPQETYRSPRRHRQENQSPSRNIKEPPRSPRRPREARVTRTPEEENGDVERERDPKRKRLEKERGSST